jgi:hypothetical protein
MTRQRTELLTQVARRMEKTARAWARAERRELRDAVAAWAQRLPAANGAGRSDTGWGGRNDGQS